MVLLGCVHSVKFRAWGFGLPKRGLQILNVEVEFPDFRKLATQIIQEWSATSM